MPAIQPARLKQQAALVVQHLEDPRAFTRSLHYLFDFYADRTHRPGKSGEPASLLEAYNVPPPVLRQLVQTLKPLIEETPEAAFPLCDALWAEDVLEFRKLGAAILGKAPVRPPEPVIERVKNWAENEREIRLVRTLVEDGLARLRQEDPESALSAVEKWLDDSSVRRRQLGLLALLPMIKDPGFQNMPRFFRMIQPLVRQVPSGLRPEVVDILTALARRTPKETAFFLRQSMVMPESPDVPWLSRRVQKEFPDDLQASLRAAAREAGR